MFNLGLYCVRSGNYSLELLTRSDLPKGYIESEYLEAEFLQVVIHRKAKQQVTLWFGLKRLTTENFPIPSFSKDILGPGGFAVVCSEDVEAMECVEFTLYRRKGLPSQLEPELLTI